MKKNQVNFYKEHYSTICKAKNKISELISIECNGKTEHFKARIKSKESVLLKLEKMQIDANLENALKNLNDIVGIRIICRFLDDVYEVAKILENHYSILHILSKDYIANPKENGYRSYHIIIQICVNNENFPIEIQIRTLSQDCWASLEHKMKYKKKIENANLIKCELKRLADEMASSDVCMQTLKDVITKS